MYSYFLSEVENHYEIASVSSVLRWFGYIMWSIASRILKVSFSALDGRYFNLFVSILDFSDSVCDG